MKDHTLSDGTFLPKGTWLAATAQAIHLDDANYPNASQFDGFRFSRLPARENDYNQMVSTSQKFLAFGHGHGSWSGRFFASNEIKTLLAHLLVTYDVKTKEQGVKPEPIYIQTNVAHSDKAEISFRRRLGTLA